MFESFSTSALTIIDEALQIAKNKHKLMVGTEHLLLALYKKKDTICHFLLEEKGILYDHIDDIVNQLVIFRKNIDEDITYTKKFQEVILFAKTLSEDLCSKYVYDEHIFYVLLREDDNVASLILDKLNIDKEELMNDIEEIFNFFDNDEPNKKTETPFPFLINLRNINKVHPYIKRSNYIDKIKYILSKKQKNNPLLIGKAGVGKTAIVEGLVDVLDNEDIYQLDLGLIVSGTKYRGELEEKITKAMEFIKNKKAIVFIDEIHNIVGAGSNDGSLDIANILKPYLSKSDIKLIGSTTLEEYYRFIEKDKALTRRFQNIYIKEPSEKETYKILKGIKKSYEQYHNVSLSDNLLKRIITLSKQYLVNKTFPDKAIDLLDEVGARKKITNQDIYKILKDTLADTIGIKMISSNKLINLKLNYPEYKTKYFTFLNRFNLDIDVNNMGTIEVDDIFKIEYLKDDLHNIFGLEEDMCLEVDLNNYHDFASINNLIGSSKGYIGYEQGGLLSEHIIKYPISLIYIKNFHKAHYSIQNYFNDLFRKNNLVDNKDRKISLVNTLFVVEKRVNNLKPSGFIAEPILEIDIDQENHNIRNLTTNTINKLKSLYYVEVNNIEHLTLLKQYNLIISSILLGFKKSIYDEYLKKLVEIKD